MKKLNYALTLATALTALTVQVSSALPTNSITITTNITGSANAVWNFSRLTNLLQNLDLDMLKETKKSTNAVEVTYVSPFIQDGAGKLVGSGTNANVTLIYGNGQATNTFTGTYTTHGTVSGSKGVTHLTFLSKVTGKTTFAGQSKASTAFATASYVMKFDAKAGTFSGRALQHASATRMGSISEVLSIDKTNSIPAELGDGSWTLALTSTNTNNKLSGTATVTLNSGEVYPFDFKGVYAPKTKKSVLNLKGVDAGKGSSLEVTLDDTTVTKLTGHISGQSVSLK